MSTNKTQNYQLHAWALADELPLGEVNENFAKLDAALEEKARVVVGAYVGTEGAMQVVLGGKPAMVLIENEDGSRYTSYNHVYGGMAGWPGGLGNYVKLENTGFSLAARNGSGNELNISNKKMLFLAVME